MLITTKFINPQIHVEFIVEAYFYIQLNPLTTNVHIPLTQKAVILFDMQISTDWFLYEGNIDRWWTKLDWNYSIRFCFINLGFYHLSIPSFFLHQGPNLETKIASQKKSEHSEENSPSQVKTFLDFVKCFSKLAKGIYETCDCNFFNFALLIIAVVSSNSTIQIIFTFC